VRTVVAVAALVGLVASLGWCIYSTITKAPAVVAAVVTGLGALTGLGVQKYGTAAG
jgi:hypothetical protein